jgi:hypothetical protein
MVDLLRDLFGYAPRWLVVTMAMLGLAGLGVGAWLIVTSIDERTEMVPAQVSASYARGEIVSFKFADGSESDEFEPGDGLYDAVQTFGPGPARITRNARNDTIEKVRFHGKTYTLGSAAGSLAGGIVGLVLGLAAILYAIRHRSSLRQDPAPAGAP